MMSDNEYREMDWRDNHNEDDDECPKCHKKMIRTKEYYDGYGGFFVYGWECDDCGYCETE